MMCVYVYILYMICMLEYYRPTNVGILLVPRISASTGPKNQHRSGTL